MSVSLEEPPRQVEGRVGMCDPHPVFEHPAFGVVIMTTPVSSRGLSLFGSELKHTQFVRLAFHHARQHRNLHADHTEVGEPVLTVEMSHAQFSQLITSSGNGQGTPVTLRYAPPEGTSCVEMPKIKALETEHDTLKREIREKSKKALEDMQKEIERLGALIESGKLPKSELRNIHTELARRVSHLPSNMEFAVEMAEEATERMVHRAHHEVEAYFAHEVQRLGLDAAMQSGLLRAPQSHEVHGSLPSNHKEKSE